jgi:2-C-methyl-D-erythritol 4-phosphate cytidylyltransferase
LGEQRLEQFTDDCGIFLACNPDANIRIVKGGEENIKITYPIDLILADEMFRLRSNLSEDDKPGSNLRGMNIVIFGGTRGIGKALTDVLLTGGAQVLVFSRKTGCDISIEKNVECALQTAINEFGSIDAVVNTAGILKAGNLNEQSGNEILEQINTNLIGALNIARYSYKWLKESKGSLLFFSSSSYTRGRSGSVVYSATKSAIVNLTQGLSEEWASEGIKVNCIIPSRTDTDMRQKNFKEESQDSLSNPYKIAIAGAKTISKSLFGQIIRVQ